MRAIPVLLVVLAACSAPPRSPSTAGDAANAGAFVRRRWLAAGGDGEWRCGVVDSADAWRNERERLGAAGTALAADGCMFDGGRLVVVQMPGGLSAPVSWQVLGEEGVHVLTLTLLRDAGAEAPARVLVLALSARDAELAVVARVPDAAGRFTETTLGVFAGR